MTLDEIKTALCKGEWSSLTIGWNEANAPNYMTVRDWLIGGINTEMIRDEDFVEPGEREKCKELNSLWTAQWYPDTPVGFHVLHAATFEALRAGLGKIAREEMRSNE